MEIESNEYYDANDDLIQESSITHKILVDDRVYDIKDDNLDKLYLKRESLSAEITNNIDSQKDLLTYMRCCGFFCAGLTAAAVPLALYQFWRESAPMLAGLTSATFCAIGFLQYLRFYKKFTKSIEETEDLLEAYDDCDEKYQTIVERYQKEKAFNHTYERVYN